MFPYKAGVTSTPYNIFGGTPALLVNIPKSSSNTYFGIFFGGSVSQTNKYFFGGSYSINGTALPTYKTYITATSSKTKGYVMGGGAAGGGEVSTVYRYSYTDGIVTTGTSLVSARTYNEAIGDTNAGFIVAGYLGGAISTTNKYTYVGDICVLSTSLPVTKSNGAGFGNQSYGFVVNGTSFSTYRLSYSGETWVASTTLLTNRSNTSACGNAEIGLVAGGTANGSIIDKFDIRALTCVSGTSLGVAKYDRSSTGNNFEGVFAQGYTNATNTTDIYNYLSGVVLVGNTIGAGNYAGAASSGFANGATL